MQAVLSDGENSLEVVISTQLSHLIQSEQLVKHTIIKVEGWQYNITDDNIHIVSVSEMDILDFPDELYGNPVSVSVLDSAHKKDVKDGFSYFNSDDDEWDDDDDSEKEAPLTWSTGEPSDFCDWTIEVTRIQSPPSSPSLGVTSKNQGKDRTQNGKQKDGRAAVQQYHVHKAILSVG